MTRRAFLLPILAGFCFSVPLSALTLQNQYIKVVVNDLNQRIDKLETTGGNPDLPSDDNRPMLHEKDPSMSSVSLFMDGRLYKIGLAGRPVQKPELASPNLIVSKWQIEQILFTQNIEIVNGTTSQLPDTVRITYTIQNQDTVSHELGVKLVFDTFNGANDDVPFVVPLIGIVATERKVTNTGTSFKIPEFFVVNDNIPEPRTALQATLRDRGLTLASPDDILFASPDTLGSTGWKPSVAKKPMKSSDGLPDTGYALFWGPITFPDASDKRSVKKLSTAIGVYTPTVGQGDILDVSLGAPKLVTLRTFTVIGLICNKDKFKSVRDLKIDLDLPEGCSLLTTRIQPHFELPELKPGDTKFLYYVVNAEGMPQGESTLTFTVKGDAGGALALSSVRRRIRK